MSDINMGVLSFDEFFCKVLPGVDVTRVPPGMKYSLLVLILILINIQVLIVLEYYSLGLAPTMAVGTL